MSFYPGICAGRAGWWVLGILALLGSHLFGQGVGPAPAANRAAAHETQKLDTMVVVGSYLPELARVTASPVVTIKREEITRSGATDALRLLKQLEPAFNGNANIGNEVGNIGYGESAVALRNLPTLVLVDGRRLPNAPFVSSMSAIVAPTVDLNTIPLHMVERVEILKDGASTLYGSDAIGGVINIILRKNYEGAEAGLRYGSDTRGSYTTRDAWFLFGRARTGSSLTFGVQYFSSSPLRTKDRALAMLGLPELAALGQDPALPPTYISPTFAGRNGNFIIAGSPLAVGASGYNPAIKTLPPKTSPQAPPLSTDELVGLGYYIPISSTPLSRAAAGSTSILNTAFSNFPVVMPNRRSQAFATGEKEIFGPRLIVFGDALYTQSVNGGNSVAPAPIASPGAANLTIPANNPYNLFGVTLGIGGGANQPGLRSRLDELGNRHSRNIVDTLRLVLGARGEIGEGWSWEAAFNYARAAGEQHIAGGARGVVMNQTLIPLLNAQGGYVYDTEGRPLSVYVHQGKNVPVYDFFGIGTNSPATLDAVRVGLFKAAQVEQLGFDFRINGRLGKLPAGEIAFAFGGEVRRERLASQVDENFSTGLAVGYQTADGFPRHDRNTGALFLEMGIPVAAPKNGVPGFHRLDLNAAVRREQIRPGGVAVTPRVGLHWTPFGASWSLRGTYSRGFIAPAIFALYGPSNQNVPQVTVLEGDGRTGSGGSTGRLVTGPFIGKLLERSNPALIASRAKSYTFGLNFAPKPIKGLSFSGNYYRIERDKVGGFDYAFIAADLNARGAASVYAPTFRFTDGTPMTSTAPNQVTSTNFGQLEVLYNPVGDLWTDGLDFGAEYAVPDDQLGRFTVGANATVILNFKARTSPTGVHHQYARNFTDASVGRGNSQGVIPNYALRTHLDYARREWQASMHVNYLPPLNASGTAFGAPAGTPNLQRLDRRPYTVASYTTANVSATYALPRGNRAWTRGWAVTAGANNVFDRDPPLVPGSGGGGGTETNTAKAAYDIIGRFMFLELKKNF